MRGKLVVAAVAALVLTLTAVSGADARARKKHHYRANVPSMQSRDVAPSLDGRITGRARTCWNETFVYDGKGVPVGPYCH
jgi:hypothetical protein